MFTVHDSVTCLLAHTRADEGDECTTAVHGERMNDTPDTSSILFE